MQRFKHSGIWLAGCIAASMLMTHGASAAGFALLEQNSSGLGNAYAGAAAIAEDASTVFFNSAGLTQLDKPSLVVNSAFISINTKFNNTGSAAALGQSLGGIGGNAGGLAVVPSFYAAIPVNDRVSGGVGFNAPFGLKTEYDADWMGRFQAIKSDVKATNINTALAFKLTNSLSLGVGVDYQTVEATLTSGVNYSAVIAQYLQGQLSAGAITTTQFSSLVAANAGLQGTTAVKGNDSTWAYDIGLLFTPTSSTKIGLSYRAATKYQVMGNATFTAPTASNSTGATVIAGARASTLADGPVTLAIKLPATTRLALAQKIGTKWEVLAEASWTQWSVIPELRIKRPDGTTLSNTPEAWKDVLRYAEGVSWQATPSLKVRVGAAQDRSPVPDSTRTPRLPDNHRAWLSAGAQLKASNAVNFDFGYTHIAAQDASLNQNAGSTTAYGSLVGAMSSKINIVGVQATVSF